MNIHKGMKTKKAKVNSKLANRSYRLVHHAETDTLPRH